MESIEAYIIELLNSGATQSETVQGIVSNYPEYDVEKAKEKVLEFVSSLQVVQNMFQNKKLKIKNNPGFLTTISKDKFDNNLKIIVSGINDISYIDTIPIYIDSLLRLTQDTKNLSIPLDEIKELCTSKVSKTKEVAVDDIIAPADKRK